MMPESRYFPPPSFSLGMNHYENNIDFFHQRQHVIKVEPEVSSRRPNSKTTLSFYNCPELSRSNSNSSNDHGSPEGSRRSSPTPPDVELSTERDIITSSKPKVAQACKVCGKVLSSASSYYVHMKQHSGNKPFQCPVCEASFCRKPYLEVHMRTHTGERPFQCSLCLKRFTQKAVSTPIKGYTLVKGHMLAIFVIKAYCGILQHKWRCIICFLKLRFAVKSYVSAHRWSHVADKPLSCEHCSQTFTSKTQYAIHARTHTPSHEFDCHLCGRSFVKDSFLIRHHYRVHRDMFPPANEFEHIAYDMRMKSDEPHSRTDTNENNTEKNN